MSAALEDSRFIQEIVQLYRTWLSCPYTDERPQRLPHLLLHAPTRVPSFHLPNIRCPVWDTRYSEIDDQSCLYHRACGANFQIRHHNLTQVPCGENWGSEVGGTSRIHIADLLDQDRGGESPHQVGRAISNPYLPLHHSLGRWMSSQMLLILFLAWGVPTQSCVTLNRPRHHFGREKVNSNHYWLLVHV